MKAGRSARNPNHGRSGPLGASHWGPGDPEAVKWAKEQPTFRCRKCKSTIVLVGSGWTVEEPGFTSDGLGFCPPDPDARRHGVHEPEMVKK